MPVSSNSGQDSAEEKPTDSKPSNVCNILVVDKDYELGQSIKASLTSLGCEVHVAHDGNAALALAELRSPDLIILDLQIPKRSGLLVLEYLAVNMEHPVPVIVITANEGSRHRRYSEMLGAVDYIIKPFTMERLVNSVTRLLNDD